MAEAYRVAALNGLNACFNTLSKWPSILARMASATAHSGCAAVSQDDKPGQSCGRFRLNTRQINNPIAFALRRQASAGSKVIPLPAATMLRSVSGWSRGSVYLHPPRLQSRNPCLIAQTVTIFQHQQFFPCQMAIGTHSRFAHG